MTYEPEDLDSNLSSGTGKRFHINDRWRKRRGGQGGEGNRWGGGGGEGCGCSTATASSKPYLTTN